MPSSATRMPAALKREAGVLACSSDGTGVRTACAHLGVGAHAGHGRRYSGWCVMRSLAPDTATHSISASAIRLAPHHSSTLPQGILVPPLRRLLAPLYGDDFINRGIVGRGASAC